MDHKVQVGQTDSFVFWTALYATPVVWGFFAFFRLFYFSFLWISVTLICMFMAGTNAVGYYYCNREYNQKMTNLIQDRAMGAIMSSIGGNIGGSLLSKLPLFGNR